MRRLGASFGLNVWTILLLFFLFFFFGGGGGGGGGSEILIFWGYEDFVDIFFFWGGGGGGGVTTKLDRMRIFLRGKNFKIFFGVLDIPDIFLRQTVDSGPNPTYEEKVRVPTPPPPPPHTHTHLPLVTVYDEKMLAMWSVMADLR